METPLSLRFRQLLQSEGCWRSLVLRVRASHRFEFPFGKAGYREDPACTHRPPFPLSCCSAAENSLRCPRGYHNCSYPEGPEGMFLAWNTREM